MTLRQNASSSCRLPARIGPVAEQRVRSTTIQPRSCHRHAGEAAFESCRLIYGSMQPVAVAQFAAESIAKKHEPQLLEDRRRSSLGLRRRCSLHYYGFTIFFKCLRYLQDRTRASI